jgi:hypothetical protein
MSYDTNGINKGKEILVYRKKIFPLCSLNILHPLVYQLRVTVQRAFRGYPSGLSGIGLQNNEFNSIIYANIYRMVYLANL